MFSKLARSCDLSAEDRKQRRLTLKLIQFQNIIARGRLRFTRAIKVKRAYAGIRPANHTSSDRFFEVLAHCTKHVICFSFSNSRLARFTMVVFVSGANICEISFIRNSKQMRPSAFWKI